MANKSRFIIAQGSIKSYFDTDSKKVFSETELEIVLEKERTRWNLPPSMSLKKFIEKLTSAEILRQVAIDFFGLQRKTRYLTPSASTFQVAGSLVNKSFFSHFSAVYLHGLTNQMPKIVYISTEQSIKRNINRDINQAAIDQAFARAQRKSKTIAKYDGYSFLLHSGMHSSRIGVYNLNGLPVTNIERTLIDITVRPNYAGGVSSVLEVYKKALNIISLNKLVAILDRFNFIYPYHQAVGFYLDKAGCPENKLEIFSSREMHYDFYLTYEIIEKEYNKKWKIYYPKGI